MVLLFLLRHSCHLVFMSVERQMPNGGREVGPMCGVIGPAECILVDHVQSFWLLVAKSRVAKCLIISVFSFDEQRKP